MYFNRGMRHYPRRPTKEVSLRYNWEFYAILSGRAAPYFSESEKIPPMSARLWLFPPRRRYAWWGEATKAHRIVFHFSTVDESLELLMGQRDFLNLALNKPQMAKLERIADEIEPHYHNLSLVSSLYFNKALAELSLLAAEGHSMQDQIITLSTKNQILARRALAFFQSQLPRRPLVDEVAGVVGVSSTHLRRIFLEVFHEPPKHLFLIAQIDRAKQLGANSDFLISDIAERSGFRGAPDLCRAFRKYNPTTFHQWRTQIVDVRKSRSPIFVK